MASVRYVAREKPHLILALMWAIVTNQDAVEALRDNAGRQVEPEQLAELSGLDPLLGLVVRASGPAQLRLSAKTPASEERRRNEHRTTTRED